MIIIYDNNNVKNNNNNNLYNKNLIKMRRLSIQREVRSVT